MGIIQSRGETVEAKREGLTFGVKYLSQVGPVHPHKRREGSSGGDARGCWYGVVGDAESPCLNYSVFLGDSEARRSADGGGGMGAGVGGERKSGPVQGEVEGVLGSTDEV